ncbi:hypothetical protein VNO77_27307 [Canavalia gladiata]|uniref:RRM domain-containing protein n=1 Tax=Canavalia gladiata TaxID=3824 RepID=A0AAN9KWQ3_CANGL
MAIFLIRSGILGEKRNSKIQECVAGAHTPSFPYQLSKGGDFIKEREADKHLHLFMAHPACMQYVKGILTDIDRHLKRDQATPRDHAKKFASLFELVKRASRIQAHNMATEHSFVKLLENMTVSFDHMIGRVENATIPSNSRVEVEGPLWFTYKAGVSKILGHGANQSPKQLKPNLTLFPSSSRGAFSGTDSYHALSNAGLFSSSLPVLAHEKLNLNEIANGYESVDDNFKKTHQDADDNDPLEDGDTHAIGTMLPNDEEELLAGIMDDFDLSGFPGSLEDLEQYDLFGSDGELRALFEQYGDIRTLYTTYKHWGFVMISYYDIRAARTTMCALQNKTLRHRKLDIHFSMPTNNPSDKEIRETPHKRHHKFIEFYDVRAAEVALKSLNRSDIAGKRIKLEPSRPRGARRNLMLQLNQEIDQDESRSFRYQVGSPIANSPPGNWLQFNSPVEQNSMQTINYSPGSRIMSPTTGNHLPRLASILEPPISDTVKVATIGNDLGMSSHGDHMFTRMNSSHGSTFQSYSLLEPKFNQFCGALSSFGPSTSNGSSVETFLRPFAGAPSQRGLARQMESKIDPFADTPGQRGQLGFVKPLIRQAQPPFLCNQFA